MPREEGTASRVAAERATGPTLALARLDRRVLSFYEICRYDQTGILYHPTNVTNGLPRHKLGDGMHVGVASALGMSLGASAGPMSCGLSGRLEDNDLVPA